ncbi:paired box protein Pax-4 [Synchiropus splendidus]|uniref:paired box protein Pax-4 n=1 Tax=Synchiropus splendidus TaxID=270530 RepID=UPI00237EBBD6|nr:paired box protein Pax-4 [Synchiropus splendidus]
MCGTGQGGCVNQLGGVFHNGRPLPEPQRRQIIQLASEGVRPSQISRILRVSNACVSKILSRFRQTGLLGPRAIGGSRPRLLTAAAVASIVRCKRENPSMFAWEIRKLLAAGRTSAAGRIPSVSSINRILRRIPLDHGAMSLEVSAHGRTHQDAACDARLQPDLTKSDTTKKLRHRSRTSLTLGQKQTLEEEFSHDHYADMFTRRRLSEEIGLPEDTIKIWFSNRRAKMRRETEKIPGRQEERKRLTCGPSLSLTSPQRSGVMSLADPKRDAVHGRPSGFSRDTALDYSQCPSSIWHWATDGPVLGRHPLIPHTGTPVDTSPVAADVRRRGVLAQQDQSGSLLSHTWL